MVATQDLAESGVGGRGRKGGGRQGARGRGEFPVVDDQECRLQRIGGEFLLAGFVGSQARHVLSRARIRQPEQR